MPFFSLYPPGAAIIILIAYLIGSIPFGLILTRLSGLGDIRHIGSGNIGATNVLRTGKKGLAIATMLLDALKGFLAVILIRVLCPTHTELSMALAAIGVVMGHCFPIWLKFRGGKGVATGIGIFWAFCWPVGLICTFVWAYTVKLSRISSAGAFLAFLIAPFLMPALTTHPVASPIPVATDMIAILIWLRHYGNLVRLVQGKENRFGQKN
ncbi:glycerol-3-phosphate 1-O-acyltransferase PlsY [Aristophania vespae]|uniref:glycerol-3-phosphate 1-O-acyltransferase PlsY n=1 Tax=Aristophania vespae TaxID=2697033 RepID=UPI0023519DE0|nr:glycerol-3-phosphate 1-O-acyltransferase PlsY [Aristophania vespae]UMM64371.1 putative glycerol-3-phosphate acyltransferase [Aristophania vespae]